MQPDCRHDPPVAAVQQGADAMALPTAAWPALVGPGPKKKIGKQVTHLSGPPVCTRGHAVPTGCTVSASTPRAAAAHHGATNSTCTAHLKPTTTTVMLDCNKPQYLTPLHTNAAWLAATAKLSSWPAGHHTRGVGSESACQFSCMMGNTINPNRPALYRQPVKPAKTYTACRLE